MILPQAPFHENLLNTRVKLKKRISKDVPSKMSFTHKSALRLPTAPCPFQDLAGTLGRGISYFSGVKSQIDTII